MLQEDKPMSEHESLLIIQQMIETAKTEQKDDGKGWIIWGWMLFAASILTVINLYNKWFESFFFWNFFGVFSILIAIYDTIQAFVVRKKVAVKTYTKAIFQKLNIGFFISLMFVIVSMNFGVPVIKGFPLLMSLYGFWILIYGAILNFKPSIIGAYVMWFLAFIALFISFILKEESKEFQFSAVMILQALGVLCGYIIPGHLAHRAFKKLKEGNKYKD